ncbi:DNA-binding CsgD family transcriptional regulator [Anaerosolibacter carboniphilus]|uniref:DNA-binding CsgD family transcriptional regulator n=1 Tax=Anaerosolibacter carboniphilus TaxID=1417629 RepID=A0A841KXZ2_9FIRM|nr:hypothetical protein [Anaerosolibacter carboniphilus]MBB6218213.1 DNA-binding CsgD family transcriptional regulator [Anaerosolibacter carboniphilus]
MGGRHIDWKKITPEMIRLRKQGYSFTEIGYKLKISRDSVAKKLKELGVNTK